LREVTRDTRETVALVLACTIGAFLLLSLVGVFVLALNDNAPENLWAALFSLATALLGGVTGWLAGSALKPESKNSQQ
jgi:membrane protein YqaA with SNARE-associated domain